MVFDTGTVVPALLFNGPAARLRGVWSAGRVQCLVSKPTLQELLRVLAYPEFGLAASDIEELLAEYLPWSRTVTMPKGSAIRAATPLPRCRDAHDQMFLELALVGGAKTLVTGDRDLLALAGEVPFVITSVADFLAAGD